MVQVVSGESTEEEDEIGGAAKDKSRIASVIRLMDGDKG